jgi:dTDP-4-amino-4,6-dideoxygalactose transaminase
LVGQLENFSEIQESRKETINYYIQNIQCLSELADSWTAEKLTESAHLMPILAKDERSRDTAIETLKRFGITAVTHYQPLDSSLGAQVTGSRSLSTENSKSVASRLYRIPLFFEISQRALYEVVDALNTPEMKELH